ncbi:MAG: hypothetical protein HRU28_00740 [Rhizobiales bacterium]|nr:hypothetical protein [Hyphomicrobiales bacterium]
MKDLFNPPNLTPKLCEAVRRKILKASQKIASEYGLVVKSNKMSDLNLHYGFNMDIRIAIPASDGTAYDPEKVFFELLAGNYGLNKSDFGREFSTGKEKFKITGINPRRPRYPISVERIPDGHNFKFEPENLLILLNTSSKN